MPGYLDAGRRLCLDNFYTSIHLAEDLLKRRTTMLGTIRSDRKRLPRSVIDARLKRGECKGLECGHGTKIMKWKNKKPTHMISTVPDHTDEVVDTGRRRYDGTPVCKPLIVMDYNQHKKGVDVADQLNSYYTSNRKGLKWFRKLALEYLLSISCTNAFLLTQYTGIKRLENMTLLQFRESVARGLINREEIPVQLPRKRRHTLVEKDGAVRSVGKKCKSCYGRICKKYGSQRADSLKKIKTYCRDCPMSPFMCLSCFNNEHK